MSEKLEEFKKNNPELYAELVNSLKGEEEAPIELEVLKDMPRGLEGNRDAEGNLITKMPVEEEDLMGEVSKPPTFIDDMLEAPLNKESIQAILSKHNMSIEEALDIYPIGEESEDLSTLLREMLKDEDDTLSEEPELLKELPTEGMLKAK